MRVEKAAFIGETCSVACSTNTGELDECLCAPFGMIPITPGGLGFVEAGLTGTLTLAGVPAGEAPLTALVYRLASYWLPILAGLVAYGAFSWRARQPGRPADDPSTTRARPRKTPTTRRKSP